MVLIGSAFASFGSFLGRQLYSRSELDREEGRDHRSLEDVSRRLPLFSSFFPSLSLILAHFYSSPPSFPLLLSCKVSQFVHNQDGRITVPALGDLVRGLGGGSFSIVETGKKGKRKQSSEKSTIDLDAVCGGKSELGKDVSRLAFPFSGTMRAFSRALR